MLHLGIIRQRVLRDDLQIAQAGTVIQFDKGKILRIAPRPHPALHQNCSIGASALSLRAFLTGVGETISRSGEFN